MVSLSLSSLKSALLISSLAFNLLLAVTLHRSPSSSQTSSPRHHHHHQPDYEDVGWSHDAAMAAEEAAAFDCNGHGDLYVDTVSDNDTLSELQCECYECFTGSHCADAVPDCDANVDSGDPLMFAPFWKQNAAAGAVLIPGWYRQGYQIVEGTSSIPISPSLEREIRKLHALVGNAVVENKYMLVGTGSLQLLNAAVESLAPTSGDPASVVSATPYYGAYRTQTEFFETSHYKWAGDAYVYAEQQGILNESSIEFVTSPNNPDGAIRSAVLNGSTASTIFDLAYYWPHFTAITEARDDDVMLFTLSKLTGHAGSRIGWAIVKDLAVFTRLQEYIANNILVVSHEAQLRATQLLRTVNRGYSEHIRRSGKVSLNLSMNEYASSNLIFHYAYKILQGRWEALALTLANSTRFSLQHLEPDFCNFFNEVTGPSPAYAWVKCELEEDEDCAAVFSEAGITGRTGTGFGSSGKYIRLSLIKRDSVFENLINHLKALVSRNETSSLIKMQGAHRIRESLHAF